MASDTPSRARSMRVGKGRVHSLDGLRALAVLLVFASHIKQRVLTGGFLGVEVFFVLSGYLITALLLVEYDASSEVSLRKFYARRVLRLYPALICLVIAVVVIDEYKSVGHPIRDGFFAITYLTDFYGNFISYFEPLLHTWSLAVEEQFYLVWPVALLIALRRGWSLQTVLIAAACVCVAVTAVLGVGNVVPRIQYLPTSHVTELGAGALLAVWIRQGGSSLVDWLSSTPVAIGSLILVVVGVGFMTPDWWAFPAVTVICLPPVAHLVTRRGSAVSRAFELRPVVWLGERSYGFYLWHYPVIAVTHGTTTITRAFLALVVTLVITELSWRVVETPFLRLKARMEPTPAVRRDR